MPPPRRPHARLHRLLEVFALALGLSLAGLPATASAEQPVTNLDTLGAKLEQPQVTVGERVVVNFSEPLVPETGEKFWITLVHPTAPDTQWDDWTYIDTGEESASLVAKEPGLFELRLHAHYPTRPTDVIWRAPVVIVTAPAAEE